MPACYLYPVIEEFREKVEDKARKAGNDGISKLLKDNMSKIDAFLNNHYDYFQLRVLYYFISVGKEHARRIIYKPFLEKGQDGYYNDIKININYKKSDELNKSLIKTNKSFNKRFEKSFVIYQSYSMKCIMMHRSHNPITPITLLYKLIILYNRVGRKSLSSP